MIIKFHINLTNNQQNLPRSLPRTWCHNWQYELRSQGAGKGRLLLLFIYPDGTRETWAYDPGGRLVTHTTRANQTKTIAYNTDNKPVSETWLPAGCAPDVACTYDETTGRLTAVNNGNALLTYTHDKLGRLTADIRALLPGMAPHTVGYLHDILGRKAGLLYPDGKKVTHTHDAQNRMTEVRDNDANPKPLAAYEYDPYGRRSKLTRDNGVITHYTYDPASQLLAIDHLGQDSTPIAHAHYEYDTMGRRVSMTREGTQTDRYRYDATSQLIAVDYGPGSARVPRAGMGVPPMPSVHAETYTYDPLGNRINHTTQPPPLNASPNFNFNSKLKLLHIHIRGGLPNQQPKPIHKDKRHAPILRPQRQPHRRRQATLPLRRPKPSH